MLKIVLLAVLIVAGVVAVSTCSGPKDASTPTPTAVPAVAVVAPTAGPGQTSVQITDDQVNQALRQVASGQTLGDTPLGTATLSSLEVHFHPGQFTADGQASVGQQAVNLSGTGTAAVEGGQVAVHFQDVQAAGISLPGPLRQVLEGSVQAQLGRLLSSSGMRVSSITLQNGSLVAVGSRS